ncbi:MAG: hypothetical protein K9N34_04455 [Candidatus Marinimicrobia bacterium]|nr:hypothetical protein [Candidatus Neomarinimicrobiota bacterium]MCF7839572.1 hypothetical protein [Candidatus Neomarinimicrobiota bacterium]MCF7903158.1 hypothetical protein [Candidatus Neomarinimicrobiota bacterium]
MSRTGKTFLILSILSLAAFSQEIQRFSQIIHLETGHYFTRSASKIAIWDSLGEWESPTHRPAAQLRVKSDDIIIQRGLSIYRYQPDRQAITSYDKRLSELESIPLSSLQIYGNIAAWGVSAWGDFWFITTNDKGQIVPTNGATRIPFQWDQGSPPERIVTFPRTMAVITDTHIIIYDLFGNKLTRFPKPSDAAEYLGFTRDTMIFSHFSQNKLIAIGTRPGVLLHFQVPDSASMVISDAKSNSVSVWSPATGRSVLTPIQVPK